MTRDEIISVLNSKNVLNKKLLDDYCDDNDIDKKLTEEDFTIGAHVGATQEAINIALSYYMDKFNIVKLMKNNIIIKYY